MINLISQRI